MKEIAKPYQVYLGLLVTAAVLFVALAEPDWDKVNWGDAPTWIAGAIALLALLAAWRAGSIARDLLKVERDREDRAEVLEAERRENAERSVQADLVAAWVASKGMRNDARPRWGTVIHNGSAVPVWDVRIQIFRNSAIWQEFTVALAPPGDKFIAWTGRHESEIGSDDPETFLIAINFRDATGRRWSRDRHGSLDKLGRDLFIDVGSALSIGSAAAPIVTGESQSE